MIRAAVFDVGGVLERVDELAGRTPEAFAEAAAAPEAESLDRPLPARLVDLVAERVERCQALLRLPIDTVEQETSAAG